VPAYDSVSPDALTETLSTFLAGSRDALVIEDGAVLFDLAASRYSITGEYEKCLLHLWSSERNIVRRVLDAESRSDSLSLSVQRLGQPKPTKLEICRQRDRRTPTTRRAARVAYEAKLRRVLERRFPGFKLVSLSSSMDLKRSFGPIYARGLMKLGQSAFAVFGVNAQEAQASIDAALTFGILWLQTCREAHSSMVVEGLSLFLPPEASATTCARVAHLDRGAAKWRVFEFDEREGSLREMDPADRGNIATRLVHSTNESSARERFAECVALVHGLMPEADIAVLSPAELAFRLHGLEFARARLSQSPVSFRSETEIVFGLGAEERVLSEENAEAFAGLGRSIGEVRHAQGPRDHHFWRLHPERWLESLVVRDVSSLDERLDSSHLYSQVPAFSASDRAMIDVLTVTRDRRLTVVELKADEDIHLPLQGLDYWARVSWHHQRGEFHKFGYFPGCELSAASPLLMLVAPALHVHPATDTLLRYISPEIEWELLAIGERWREEMKVVFRKRSSTLRRQAAKLRSAAALTG
jgi:hypothetical protein